MLPLPETLSILQLYRAGAHLEALARALGRDVRTVRKTLRQAGVALRTDPPLPTDWRTGLPRETLTALEAYGTDLGQRQRVAWQQLRQTALDTTSDCYVFASPTVYATALQTASPPESLLDLARRLDLDLTRVLLAYAAWAEQRPMTPPPPP